jgi:hypothetical protein
MRAEMGPVHGMKAILNIISCQSAALSLPNGPYVTGPMVDGSVIPVTPITA